MSLKEMLFSPSLSAYGAWKHLFYVLCNETSHTFWHVIVLPIKAFRSQLCNDAQPTLEVRYVGLQSLV